MKSIIIVIAACMLTLPMFCVESHAQIKSASIRIGGDILAFSSERKTLTNYWQRVNFNHGSRGLDNRISIGVETVLKQFDTVPTLPEIGLGIEYQFPRENCFSLKTFSFLPVYGLARFKILSFKNIYVTKLVIKTGYNWFENEEYTVNYNSHPYYTANYSGGIYYGIGIDHIFHDKILIGIHASEHNAKNEITPNSDSPLLSPHTEHIKYRKVTFVIGYVFQ
ncbi:hypothetical protein ACFL6K_06245 [Candidatus Latescibacterota bacterium]